MINNTPGSKLDETVKSTLDNYEAQYDASDWSRMEQMLDATPKSGNFKWSHAITAIVVLVVLTGGYALYNTFGKHGTTNTELNSTTPPAPANTPKESPQTATPPPVATSPVASPPVKEEPVSTPEKIIESPVVKSPVEEKVIANETKVKVKKEKAPKKDAAPEPIIEAHDKIIGMGNEPVFGDMLDSSKGIIGNTREKEETKKAAKAKKNTPVSWGIFTPHMNVDSMRKVREQRDSLKNQ